MKKNKDELLSFLREESVCHLATVTDTKMPHLSSVYYHVSSLLSFYILTLDKTEKYKNIKKNPNVALIITNEHTLQTVQVEGTASDIIDPVECEVFIEIIAKIQARNKASWPPPITKLDKGHLHVLMIKPARIRYFDFKKNDKNLRFDQSFTL